MWTFEQTAILICHLSVALTGTCPYTVSLSGIYSYQELPLASVNTSTSVVLDVKACMNAHVAISNSLDLSKNMYEFVFGASENTYVCLRSCKLGCTLGSQRSSWLSCTEFRTVWVAWGSPGVRMGIEGRPDNNTLVSTTSGASLAVHHVWISMYSGTAGDWRIPCREESTSAAATTTSTTQSETTQVFPNTSEVSALSSEHETATTVNQTTPLPRSASTVNLTTPLPISTSTEQNVATGMPESTSGASTSSTELGAMTSTSSTELGAMTSTSSTELGAMTSVQSQSELESTSMLPDGTVEASSAAPYVTDASSESTADKQADGSTTSAPVTSPRDAKLFHPAIPRCRCEMFEPSSPLTSALAMQTAEKEAEKIVEELKLKEETSAHRRQLESANDRRPSAKFLGTTAVALIAGAALLVTAPDLLTLLVWAGLKLGVVKRSWKRSRQQPVNMQQEINDSPHARNLE